MTTEDKIILYIGGPQVLVLLGVLLWASSGFAKEKVVPPLPQHFEYVLQGKTCNNAPIVLVPSDTFRCAGPDKEHLVCTGMTITVHSKVDDCMQLNVVHDNVKIQKETK